MKTFALLALISTASFFALTAKSNPLSPYDPRPVCKNGFVATQIPDGTWRCLPRYH